MGITRRAFMKGGAMAVVGTTAIPSFLTRAAWGAVNTGASNKRLVVIFQRGAADGLNIVVPHAEPAYYAMRLSINIPRQLVPASCDGAFQTALGPAPSRRRSRRRLARHYAFAFRRTGLHGVGHSRREGHKRWLAQPYVAIRACCRRLAVPRDRPRHFAATNSFGQSVGRRSQQRERIRHRWRQSCRRPAG